MSNQFIGFGSSEEWLAAIDKSKPVNAECITELGSGGKYGIRLATQAIILSQVAGNEVLYFLCPVDRYQTLGTTPMSDDEKHIKRGKTAYDVTLTWLERNGLNSRRAMVAIPRSLKRLEGTAEYMHYDKEQDCYEAVQS